MSSAGESASTPCAKKSCRSEYALYSDSGASYKGVLPRKIRPVHNELATSIKLLPGRELLLAGFCSPWPFFSRLRPIPLARLHH